MVGRISFLTAMLLSIRSLLPLLLVVLQFFAPLLHAHTGLQNKHFGLHVPGLEAYTTAVGGVFAGQPEAGFAATEGLIVAIDDGIREQRNQSVENPSCGDCLPVLAWFFNTAAESHFIAEFPRPPLLLLRPRSRSLSPRAPPFI